MRQVQSKRLEGRCTTATWNLIQEVAPGDLPSLRTVVCRTGKAAGGGGCWENCPLRRFLDTWEALMGYWWEVIISQLPKFPQTMHSLSIRNVLFNQAAVT